ncbi:Ankyrin repeat-containing domain [Penicillium camemberti]|uniref:Ankyrin repeat-containing domain n=1 Tax=Penicillium camemberti (strain FM 013) TaxID=1429867 RepID=A0A0G4PFE9_PENC3|nr:Ankyrin repeat-containing domain [Penicillium camemberti]
MSSPDSDGNDAIMVGLDYVRDFNMDNILCLPPADIVEIRKWLQPTAYDLERSEYARHRLSYLAGTGKWLTSTTTFQQWYQGDEDGLLWVKGIPGSGKSVLAASIINQLQRDGIPVIFFFFRQIIDANHQPVSALRDWLCQLLDYSPTLQIKLKNYIDDHRDLDSLSPTDLWKDLKLALATFPRVYCVTDALDEMDQGNDEFLHALVDLGQWRPSNVKVLITSRPVSTVENSLRSFSIPQIRLEEKLVDLDIAAYVQYKLRHSSIAPESWSVIEEAIPGRANGLFLYAKLSMDAFLEPGADANEVLKVLPADLNVMYNNLLHEHATHSSVPEDLQLLVLQFVTHATRPLRILEIAEMAKSVQGPTTDRGLKDTKDLVRAACGPLLEILPDETVSVVHHSFTEFLKGFTRSSESDDTTYPILQPGSTNKSLAIACLGYLRSGCLADQDMKETTDKWEYAGPKDDEQRELKLQFPFLEYAAHNWHIHIRRAVSAGEDMALVYTMLDAFFAERRIFTGWRVMAWPKGATRGITALHVAAWAGLSGYAAHLLERGVIIEARDACENTALYWAATSGHHDVVQVLLANGADPNAEHKEGYNALHMAAKKNHAAVAKLLLTADVDPLIPKTKEKPGRRCGNAPTSRGDTPLMYACYNGHAETVAEFLPFLKNIHTCHQALCWAANAGQYAVVELIIQHPGVDVNGTCRGETALFAACCGSGDVNTIRALLRAGADPNILCAQAGKMIPRYTRRSNNHADQDPTRGNTALHAICGSGKIGGTVSPAGVDSLLQAGANVHVRSPIGKTALHYACDYHKANVVKMLLEAGADPTAEDDSGATPLHTEGKRDEELLPVLLGTGTVDINKAIGKTKKTPLLFRLQGFNMNRVLAFLEYKPDVNIADTSGNGPLHKVLAKYETHGGVIHALISLGANPNAMNNEGNTPLHTMNGKHSPFISKLVDAGADLEARNHDGYTVLFNHANEGPFQTLIDLGARLDTRDSTGRTLSHRCCTNTDRLDYLISLGLDPLATDHQGNSLLMEVAATRNYRQIAIMKHLVALGLDIDQQNHHGRTALHALCAGVKLSSSSEEESSLDYLLGVCKSVNSSDCQGVQPLHLAATISESHVLKLLSAGADMFKVTNEGMSVLHIAARTRQPNIVALFCSRLTALGAEDRTAFVNQQTTEGETALHYACCSGRPETVRELLEAGADPSILDSGNRSPFRACAQFEAEEQLWSGRKKVTRTDYLHAAGVLVHDHQRPFFDPPNRHENYGVRDTEHDTVRLDEILDLLVCHGALSPGKNCLQETFNEAISNRYEYTLDALSRLQSRLPDVKPYHPHGLNYLICKRRLDATKQAFREYDGHVSTLFAAHDYAPFMTKLMFARQYDLFEEVAEKRFSVSKLSRSDASLMHRLVGWGYKELLERVCDKDAALRFDDHKWCQEAETEQECTGEPTEPLLVTACDRNLPNMDVVEFLVEKVGVNLNAQFRETSVWDGTTKTAGGAIHKIALGRSWWQVYKALPYLITQGADIDLRSEDGVTPLHAAMNSKHGPFRRDAVEILIKCGADVNAVDDKGETCLSKASNDLEMTRLLMDHGAHISAAAIFSAISMGEIETLEILLSLGDYANLRRPEAVTPREEGEIKLNILDSEVSPLLFVAIPDLRSIKYHYNKPPSRSNVDENLLDIRIMTILLNHGADPFATYVGELSCPEYDTEEPDPNLDEPDISPPQIEPQRHTIIHEILKSEHISGPFFQLPSLELERRDSSGCTLLLAASQSLNTLNTKVDFIQAGTTITKTIFQELIDRGANAMAQDNDGNTILHHLESFGVDSELFKTLKGVIIKNPGLLNQPNKKGETFFHRILILEDFDLIDDLLELGANPLQPDPNGNTALHHLAEHLDESQAHFKRFLAAGVDINSRNNQGDTPLFKYIETDVVAPGSYRDDGSDEKEDNLTEAIFNLFDEAGADFFAQNNAGSSLLHLLASKKVSGWCPAKSSHNMVRRFQILMDRGLDPLAEDARQRTSLDVAAVCGSDHIMKLFARKPME